jgi:acetyl esterase/lipase
MTTLRNALILLALAIPAAAQTQYPFSFGASSYTVQENGTPITVTINRNGSTASPMTVYWSAYHDCHEVEHDLVCAGNEAGPADFPPQGGGLNFAAGETSKTVSVRATDDAFYEENETFQLIMNTDGQPVASRPVVHVTIVDDDPKPTVTFTPAAVSIREGQRREVENAEIVNVTFTRTALQAPAVIHVRTVTGTAKTNGPLDFVAADKTLSLAAGQDSATIPILIYDNYLWDGDRSFTVEVVNGAAAANHATVTIQDDEALIRYRWAQNYDVEEGRGSLPVTIVREGLTTGYSRIWPTIMPEVGDLDADAFINHDAVEFAPGETSKTLMVAIRDDAIQEPTEQLTLALRIAGHADDPHNPPTSTLTIHDNDGPPSNAALSVAGTSVTEGNSGTRQAVFAVTLNEAVSQPVTVHYETQDGNAAAGTDYNATSGTLTFATGETSRTVSVAVLGDTVVENDEQFFLQISDAIGARIQGSRGRATIVNDDSAPANQIRGLEFARAGSQPLSLDLYLPTSSTANAGGLAGDEATGKLHPLVIWIHGDHWADGSRESSPAEREVRRGYVVASIDYRLSSTATYPAQINDVKAAVRWLRANASRYDIDPNRIAVWGFGSGGHLAALLGTSGNGTLDDPSLGNGGYASNVQAVVEMAAPLDLRQLNADALACSAVDHGSADSFESRLLGCPVLSCGEQIDLANPATYITRDDPPFLLLHGTNDCEVGVQQAVRFAEQLRAAGIDVTLKTYEGIGHADAFWQSEEALATVDAFLDAKLKAPPRRRAMGR